MHQGETRKDISGARRQFLRYKDNVGEVTRILIDKVGIRRGRGWIMKFFVYVVGVSLLVSSFAFAQDKQSAKAKPQSTGDAAEARGDGENTAAKLPVRRVVLYKNGVGYFEHLGRVRGSQDVHIDFTSAQLNDVLKSLTVLDLAGGRITGVDYNSEAPLARRLATLRLALGEKPTVSEFLGALRGARIEVRGGSGPVLAGKLLSVERKTRTGTNWTVETDEISLITDGGEVRSVDLNPTTSVRIADKDLQIEVGRYLGLIASARDQDVRRMTISTAGNGERNLYVSYISEVPIWKTTYRIVLPTKADKKPLLQGWAIVDNTVGEDWNNVELSLVAGAPHSYIQQLSLPYYGRRPVVGLPESVELTPQTHAETLEPGSSQLNGQVTDPTGAAIANAKVSVLNENNQVVAQGVSDEDGEYSFDDLPVGNYRIQVESPGFQKLLSSNVQTHAGSNSIRQQLNLGSVSEMVTVSAAPPRNARNPKNLFMLESMGMANKTDIYSGASAQETAAKGKELGDLFEYKLKERLTIRQNQSALVPILQTDIVADRVSLWSESLRMERPLRALWLNNTSSLTLDGGSFSVLDENTFAGEGLLEAVKPGERRLISYATDFGMTLDTKLESEQQRVTRVRIYRGVMTTTSEAREKKTYTVRNEDTTTRTLVLEHPARPEWRLAADVPKPEEIAAGVYRFRLAVEPKKTEKFVVNEAKPLFTQYSLNSVTDDQINFFLLQKSISPEIEKALRAIVTQKGMVANFDTKIQAIQKSIDQIFTDQGRLRENMKALKGSTEERALLQRYTKQLDEEETQLDSQRKAMRELQAQRDQANTQLEKMINDLQLEAVL